MEKKKMRLKGQLRMYMHWPLIMAVLLVVMNIWMYAISRKAGAVMSIFIIIYLAIAGALYFYNRSIITMRSWRAWKRYVSRFSWR